MNWRSISRRRLLRQATLASATGALVGMAPSPVLRAAEPTRAPSPRQDGLSVLEFGAAGDGRQDDTPAFEAALKAAAQSGGNVVRIPRGNYLIRGTLDVPENVVLEGYFRAPTARTQSQGSTLLAVADAGKADGQPFLTLHQNSMLCGLTIFYPEQKQTNPPVPYPWTVRGIGDNCSLVDVLLVNPYQPDKTRR